MLAGEYLVAHRHDQLVAPVIKAFASMVRVGGGFFQNGVGCNHLMRNKISADAEVLKGALGLGAP